MLLRPALLFSLVLYAASEERAPMLEDSRFAGFASAIGYSEMPRGVDPGEGVVFDWTQWTSLPAAGPGWKLIHTGVQHRPPAASRKFDFRREGEELSLEVLVSSRGPPAARQHLLEIGTSTAMLSSPYRKGPADLGDLAIVAPSRPAHSIVWTYRNVCFHLETYHSPLDLMAVAYELQKEAAQHLVTDIARQAPAVSSVIARPQTAALQEVVRVTLQGSRPLDPEKLDIDVSLDGDGLRAVAQDGLLWEFSAVKAGTTGIGLQVVDKRTLLSAFAATAVTIAPPSRP